LHIPLWQDALWACECGVCLCSPAQVGNKFWMKHIFAACGDLCMEDDQDLPHELHVFKRIYHWSVACSWHEAWPHGASRPEIQPFMIFCTLFTRLPLLVGGLFWRHDLKSGLRCELDVHHKALVHFVRVSMVPLSANQAENHALLAGKPRQSRPKSMAPGACGQTRPLWFAVKPGRRMVG